tara:strand:- start:7878 stop:8093 length:216 start_codon:yes stop_codon:yes gene_type:complete
MVKEIKLKPGMDTAEFVIKFNEMNFDIMCGLDLDHETGMYGMVFFERGELVEMKSKPNLLTRILNWFKEWL